MRSQIVCLAALVAFAAPVRADECKPLQLAVSVDLVPAGDTRAEFVPVELMGKRKLMLLDTGGVWSEILPRTADELGLARKPSRLVLYHVADTSTANFVTAKFQMGPLKVDDFDMMVMPENSDLPGDEKFAGTIAPNVLRNFDADIDFGTNKLNLMLQDHCEGKVIYWKADSVAIVPITVTSSGHILAHVKLDGRTQYAMLDTGSSNTTLINQEATYSYGLKLGAVDTPQSGNLPGHADMTVYQHVFKSLEFEGISVANATVDVIPNPTRSLTASTAAPETGSHISAIRTDESAVTMLIGMNVLRHFHLYIAYKEERLYITPAGAVSAVAGENSPTH